jgi:hypothetical protein
MVAGPAFFPYKSTFYLILALTAILLAGCGDDEAPPTAPPSGGRITVSPITPTVLVGDTLRFTATVENLSPGVVWSLHPASPFTDSLGTITQDGLYRAPVRVTSKFASQVEVRATSAADPGVVGGTILTVPRIKVTITPATYESVLPGSILPFEVRVANAHDPSFRLFVDGFENGNATVGTFTATSDTTAVYMAAASENSVIRHELLAKSVEDTTRFATPAAAIVRGGRAMGGSPTLSQFSPEWAPVGGRLAYVEGPPFKLVIYDTGAETHTPIADLSWPGTVYDGRVAWNSDGSRLVFSEESGGRRVLGFVNAAGTNRQTFDPDPALEFMEASYRPLNLSPPASPESLVVSVRGPGTSQLRAYLASETETGAGRLIYTAPAGSEVRWPDAAWIQFEVKPSIWITAVSSGGGTSEVLSIWDDGETIPWVVASGSGLRSRTSWAIQDIVRFWINFIWDGNQNYYRVRHKGSPPAVRIYTDLFPQTSGDVSIGAEDLHAISRLEDSGLHRIWIVEYPPGEFIGVPKAQELEMESIGIRGAIQPNAWRRWLGDTPWIARPGSR